MLSGEKSADLAICKAVSIKNFASLEALMRSYSESYNDEKSEGGVDGE